MERHGGKTVFFGRFIAVLRYTAAWIAGLARMEWWRFLFWNAAGGIGWATAIGLLAYYGGQALADSIARYGVYGAGIVIAGLVLVYLILHFARKRLEQRL